MAGVCVMIMIVYLGKFKLEMNFQSGCRLIGGHNRINPIYIYLPFEMDKDPSNARAERNFIVL